ncbi:MAG TPA: hypothetical protein VN697_11515 [Tepidiformaceae bacterium]|nr:hypothetical protein [Tepidiformaceae bacterium]
MSDRRPDCIYGVLVRDGTVFLSEHTAVAGRQEAGNAGAPVLALPGGIFRPLADDRKAELKAHLYDQLAIMARAVWAQGAFMYQHPLERRPRFSGFYTVWEWDGDVSDELGVWLDADGITASALPPPLRVLLLSVLATLALRTR